LGSTHTEYGHRPSLCHRRNTVVVEGRRLHVAHIVVTDAFAGVERYVSDVAAALARRGLAVTVIGGSRDGVAPSVGHGVVWRAGSSPSVAAASLARTRPDIVHSHMTTADGLAVALRAVHRAPVVSTRHFALPRGASRLGRIARPVVERGITRDVAISNYVAASVGGRCAVIRNGVANAEFHRRPDHTVLVAQRLEREKQTGVALRAWAASRLPSDGWRLVIAGRGACAPSLRALAAELGVRDSVEFRGFVSNLDELWAQAAALVATAPAEPFGLAVTEAMARAIPVVAAAGGGHLETVGAVSHEWLFPPGDHEALQRLLDRLALSAAELEVYGRQLQQYQRQEFSLEGHVDKLVDLYRGLR